MGAERPEPGLDLVAVENAPPKKVLLQDHRGLLWFGGSGQVFSFDGYESRAFNLGIGWDRRDFPGTVAALDEDRDGNLWVATLGAGLYRLERKSGRIDAFRHDPGDHGSLGSDRVRTVLAGARGAIWVGTDAGLDRLDLSTKSFTHFRHDPADPAGLAAGGVRAIAEHPSGRFWVSTDDALNLLDPATGSCIRHLPDTEEPGSLPGGFVMDLVRGTNGELWVISQGAVSRWDGGRGAFATLWRAQENQYVRDAAVGRDGRLWFGGSMGLCAIDPVAESCHCWPLKDGDPATVTSVLSDRSGVLWVTTAGGSVGRWDPRRAAHEPTVLPESPLAAALRGRMVNTLYNDRHGDIWASGLVLDPSPELSDVAVLRWSPDTGRVQRFSVANRVGSGLLVVSCFTEDRRGRLWAGTAHDGLAWVDVESQALRWMALPELEGRWIVDIAAGTDGDLWIACSDGHVFRYHHASGGLDRYLIGEPGARGSGFFPVKAVLVDSRGRVWVGGSGPTVQLYHPEADAFRRVGGGDRFLAGITDLYEDRQGRIWVATSQDGLHRLDADVGSVERLSTADGLPWGSVDTILDDGRGRLWLVCGPTLVRMVPDTRAMRSYDTLREVGGMFVWSIRKGDGDAILVGTTSGLLAFGIDNVVESTVSVQVSLTGIEISGQPLTVGDGSPLDLPTDLDLRYDQNSLSFTFASLDFVGQKHSLYGHILEGLETSWRTVGTRRTVDYTHLRPGKYVFRVRGNNHDGFWSEHEAEVRIRIRPPWWRTWWAYTIAIGAFVGFWIFVHWLRIRYVVRAKQRLELEVEVRRTAEARLVRSEERLRLAAGRAVIAREDERRRIARDLHDGVNQQLAMLAVSLGMLNQRRPPGEDELSGELNDLKRNAIDVSDEVRRISHNLHPGTLEHLGLVKALRHECEEFEKGEAVQVRFYVENEPESIEPEKAVCLYRVVQEALMNVSKHAGADNLRIDLTWDQGGVRLLIEDDGKGFEIEEARSEGGLGLISMEERVRMLGGRLSWQSAPGRGCRLEVRIE